MLNPPLSLLSNDLFLYIVNHVAELPSPNKHLSSLSIADRVFTRFCQTHIFKVLYLDYGSETTDSIPSHLPKIRKILKDKPLFANSVRMVSFDIFHDGWLFNDRTFISIFQLLAKSSRPPHQLHLSSSFLFEDPILIIGRFMQTFFSKTLTVLHLTYCKNVPLTIFLICPGLREILLDDVEASEKSYDKYPDGWCSGRELPTLDSLDYRQSESLVKQMIAPLPGFHPAVILWSKLRVLSLSPHEKEEMACLQPILNVVCNTLEELYLTKIRMSGDMISDQLSLAGLVNLRDLLCLRVFALYAIISCDAQKSDVLHDINIVLSTIPTFNKVTSLTFTFAVSGQHPFPGCLEEDWVGLSNQVVRISGWKHLKLNFNIAVFRFRFSYPTHGADELCERIMERIRPLSKYSNIMLVQKRKELYPIMDYLAKARTCL